MLTVDTVTIIRHCLNFAICTVTPILVMSIYNKATGHAGNEKPDIYVVRPQFLGRQWHTHHEVVDNRIVLYGLSSHSNAHH